MASKKNVSTVDSGSDAKSGVSKRLISELKKQFKDRRDLEVIGHIESAALCCGNGTVAIVKFDKSQVEKRPG